MWLFVDVRCLSTSELRVKVYTTTVAQHFLYYPLLQSSASDTYMFFSLSALHWEITPALKLCISWTLMCYDQSFMFSVPFPIPVRMFAMVGCWKSNSISLLPYWWDIGSCYIWQWVTHVSPLWISLYCTELQVTRSLKSFVWSHNFSFKNSLLFLHADPDFCFSVKV